MLSQIGPKWVLRVLFTTPSWWHELGPRSYIGNVYLVSILVLEDLVQADLDEKYDRDSVNQYQSLIIHYEFGRNSVRILLVRCISWKRMNPLKGKPAKCNASLLIELHLVLIKFPL